MSDTSDSLKNQSSLMSLSSRMFCNSYTPSQQSIPANMPFKKHNLENAARSAVCGVLG